MCRGIKRHEDIPTEEIADIELVGEDFPPGTYMSFTPTFKYLGTIISWDLREVKDVEARIKSANKLFGSAKATFWSNARVPFELRMRFYKAIVVNILLWGLLHVHSSQQHRDRYRREGLEPPLSLNHRLRATTKAPQSGETVAASIA